MQFFKLKNMILPILSFSLQSLYQSQLDLDGNRKLQITLNKEDQGPFLTPLN